MELGTLILESTKLSEEAHKAFHAGHPNDALEKMHELGNTINNASCMNVPASELENQPDESEQPKQDGQPT